MSHLDASSRTPGPRVLAIDIGPSSVRAILYDAGPAGRRTSCPDAYDIDTGHDGRSSFDAIELRRLAETVIDEVWRHLGDESISAVGISCFWHSLVGLAKRERPSPHSITGVITVPSNRSIGSATPGPAHMARPVRLSLPFELLAGQVLWLASPIRRLRAGPPVDRTRRSALPSWLDSDALSLCMASGMAWSISPPANGSPSSGTYSASTSHLPPIVDRDESAHLKSGFAIAGPSWLVRNGIPR